MPEQTLTEASAMPDECDWHGPTIRYDIVKEFVVALVVMTLLAVGLAVVLSSPDEPAVTIRQWSQVAPRDFLTTAVSELDGTSATATYGPPYNAWQSGEGQKIFFLGVERWVGVHVPVNTATDFVLDPLQVAARAEPALRSALDRYSAASTGQQSRWTAAFAGAISRATVLGGQVVPSRGSYGPVEPMMDELLVMARTGALDAQLLASPHFYGTDYTKPLLFIADGSYMADKADAQHLSGDQWGMMNETGNYPGQAWLWLYTMWYQVSPFSSSANADALVWALMMLLTLGLLLVPYLPGVRSIPRLVPVYRLIWRDHYRRLAADRSAAPSPPAGRSGP